MKLPKWTIVSNVLSPGSRWVGTCWEFFDDEPAAQARYTALLFMECVPTMRPYYHAEDRQHLGAGHQLEVSKKAL